MTFSKDRLDQFRQTVYSNAINDRGACRNCTRRPPKPMNHPEFGGLNPNARVALVNNEPAVSAGGSSDGELPSTIDENYTDADGTVVGYDEKLLDGWIPRSGGGIGALQELAAFVFRYNRQNLDSHTTISPEHKVDIDLADTYYTNSVKCPKHAEREMTTNEKNSRSNCRRYLTQELTSLPHVDVVVTGGKRALGSVIAALELELPTVAGGVSGGSLRVDEITNRLPGIMSLITDGGVHGLDQTACPYPAIRCRPVIVPTLQFSGGFGRINQFVANPRFDAFKRFLQGPETPYDDAKSRFGYLLSQRVQRELDQAG